VTQHNDRPFGVKVELPDNDPMRMPHLLGEDWAGTRWYASAEERDVALAAILKQPAYYRKGDIPSINVSKIDP